MIFDSHGHYESKAFDGDRDRLLSEVLPAAGVRRILNVGSDLAACRETLALTRRYGYLYGGVGIHPECAKTLPEDWLAQIREMLGADKMVAVGEIGLDYHWLEACPKERQKEVFLAQLALAAELDLPVVIHDREAHGDMMEILRRTRPKGVMHCFSGSVELSRELVKMGMYIGLGGAVTFKNARHTVAVAADLPLERLLLETDAPYMAPEPCRGQRNDASLIRYIAQRIGEIRGISPEAVCKAGMANGARLFGL